MKRPKSGDVVEIPLLLDLGYGYAKYLDPRVVWETNDMPPVLRIFLFKSLIPIDSIGDIKRDLLIAPIGISGSNGIYKIGWRNIGNEPVAEDEKFLPHVKTGWPPIIDPPERWAYYEDLGDPTKMHFSEFHKISHLESSRVLNIETVSFRMTMEFLKLEGRDIKTLMPELDFFSAVEYSRSFTIPPYNIIPQQYRGRAKK
ncbi:immunity 26/phosphotriesterase HocA family protein [Niabella pedocola]|uniref:Immunity 26/phosphotriesterase HocA family protein n=1 Tax=Niabella pedocola TaxID=1752077 RepID=A0ABS8Q059_9BACT|nr:Imm26 family immunity protein [Niabella pedocola]MCD2425927.1 immunity 26/phosphotriesterase HocA family protein [Niabella pedocola]